MSYGVYANFEPHEGTVTTETTVDLNRVSRRLVITNGHPSNALSYKFKEAATFGTLKGTETISLYFRARKVIIDGNGPYRIWSYG